MNSHAHGCSVQCRGFTLIELLVVLAVVALMSTLALPRYFQSIDTSKEVILAENLHTTRDTIDKFYADTGRYPNSLDELVERAATGFPVPLPAAPPTPRARCPAPAQPPGARRCRRSP